MAGSEVLLDKFLGGSLESFDELVSIHEKEIYNIIRCLVLDSADAEEVAAKVFIRLLDDAERPDVRANVRMHLLRCAWSEIRSLRFEQALSPKAELSEEIERVCAGDSSSAVPVLELRRAVATMPSEVGMAFVLRGVCGLSLDSTADVLNVSQERSIARLTTAFRILRKDFHPGSRAGRATISTKNPSDHKESNPTA